MTTWEVLIKFNLVDTQGEVHAYADELQVAFDQYAGAIKKEVFDEFSVYLDAEIKRNEGVASRENRKMEGNLMFQGAVDALELAKEKLSTIFKQNP